VKLEYLDLFHYLDIFVLWAGIKPIHPPAEGSALSLKATRADHVARSEINLVIGDIAPALPIREN